MTFCLSTRHGKNLSHMAAWCGGWVIYLHLAVGMRYVMGHIMWSCGKVIESTNNLQACTNGRKLPFPQI